MLFASRTQHSARTPLAGQVSGTRPGIRRSTGIGALVSLFVLAASAPAQEIVRVSVDPSGGEGNAPSVASVLSADGATSGFSSYATNLVAGDANGFQDVFVRDATTLATVLVSLSSTGVQGNGASHTPSLSGNGRFLAFTSAAGNLVPGDTNGVTDVFVHDRDPDADGIFDEGNGVTERVSVDSFGLEAHGASYLDHNRALSDDGRLVVFASAAGDLVAGDGNGVVDIFVHDRISGTTTRVSMDSSGLEANLASYVSTISGNGAVVAFQSDATNLVSGDTNGVTDVFTRDLQSGLTTRVSVESNGLQFGDECTAPALSSNGGVIAFKKASTRGYVVFDICVHDNATGSTQQITDNHFATGTGFGWGKWPTFWSTWSTAASFPAVSADGSRVAYVHNEGWSSLSSDWDGESFYAYAAASIRAFDRPSDVTLVAASYSAANFSAVWQALSWTPFSAPALSGAGGKLAFESDSPILVAGDTNGVRDAFACAIFDGDPIGTSYCTANPNSTGQSASISAFGSTGVSTQTLALQATHLPPGVHGRFFYGTATTSFPFGDGVVCVGGMLQRLPIRTSDAAGVLTEANVFSATTPFLPIVAGTTCHFQALYRDAAAMMSGFNLTNSLMISFVP